MTHSASQYTSRISPRTQSFQPHLPVSKEAHERIKTELRQRGAVAYDVWLPETRYLPRLLRDNEHIRGSVYGRYKEGRGVLVATDQRVLFLDKKPLFFHCDEINYRIINGITYTRAGLFASVTIRTREGDFTLRTINRKNADNFVDSIQRTLESMPIAANSYDAIP